MGSGAGTREGWATHLGERCQVAERSQGGSPCPLGIPHEVGICGRRREIAYVSMKKSCSDTWMILLNSTHHGNIDR